MKLSRISLLAVGALLAWTAGPLAADGPDGPERWPAGLVGFGSAAVISGDELFVGRSGMPPGFPMPAAGPGFVHHFEYSDGEWIERGALRPDDSEGGDLFGTAIALDGDRMAVSAPGVAAVYVFERSGGDWSQVARLAGESQDGAFGHALALEGDLLFIGVPKDGAGRVAVARRADAGWEITGHLTGEGATDGDYFGQSLAVDDGRLLVGSPGEFAISFVQTGQPDYRPGAAYVFEEADGAWTQTARLTSTEQGIAFGSAVLWMNDAAFVSIPTADNAAGSVHRFVEGDAGWTHDARIAPTETVQQRLFGAAMAATSGYLMVSAPMEAGGQGRVYAFREGDGGWTQVQVLQSATTGLAAVYGWTLAAADDWAFIGAPGSAFFEGMGYVFREDDETWVESGAVSESDWDAEPVTGGQLDCTDGDAAGFACSEVDLVAYLPRSALGGERGFMLNDIWGWTDSDSGREYAIVGRFDGTSFVDVTEPENPVYLGNLPLTEGANPNLWRDMKVHSDHVFIVADNAGQHGVQVFDLTRLRGLDGSSPEQFTEDAHYDGFASAHNIVINTETGFAFAVGASGGGETCGGALHMIDVRNPKSPVFAGCFGDPATGNANTGYTHDSQCVVYRGPDEEYRGREICFNASETALGIADVSDKENPAAISNASYPNVAYAHQGWLSSDHQYFYLNDELDELGGGTEKTRTLVWDVKDLDDPVLVNEYMGPTAASDHNLYVRGNLMYQANYVSGLRVIDISDPENPVEIGFFDTVSGGEDAPGFAGAFSNYPFFDSGIVLVSSMREGLFILKPRQPELVP